jgi:DHA2 family multidrug resistance protein
VLRLGMLKNPKLASPIALMGVIGMLLFSSLFITPQFLAAIAGYNALQAGQVAFISGIVAIPSALMYPLLAAHIDTRAIVAGAVMSVALGAYFASRLTADSVGADFVATQLLFGIGTTLTAIPLQQTLILVAPPDAASEASSLISVARNLGGSIGLAAIASFQDQRLEFHHWQLNASLLANDGEVQRHIAEVAALFGGGGEGLAAGYRLLDMQILLQAQVMTINDMFLTMAVIGLLVTPLVLLLRPVQGKAAGMMH